jgi:hypothetical protein
MSRKLTVPRVVMSIAMVPFALIAVAAICFFVDSALDARAGHQFERVQMNAKAQDVEAMMGRPDITRPCGKYIWWGSEYRGEIDGRCVTEVHYEHFPSAWAFGYSADGHVVDKYRYVSE